MNGPRARRARSPQPRRSHAERTAETRARILAAALEAIAERGFQRTTAAEITRRAGVTWGAVQHHFGGKEGLLVAVVENSFARFAARLADVPGDQGTLEERVALFVDRAWQHFSSDAYRSTFEILLDAMGDVDDAGPADWQGELFRAWHQEWMRLFHDAPIARSRHRLLEHYTISVLSGLASMQMLEGPRASVRREELDLLVRTLTRELTAGD